MAEGMDNALKVLSSVLRPLAYWYEQEGIEEIAVNHPGSVWLRYVGRQREFPWEEQKDPKLTREYLIDLLHIIANTRNQPFEPTTGVPVVFSDLPGGGYRFTGIAGPNVLYNSDDLNGGVALAVRLLHPGAGLGFADFDLRKGERLRKVNRLMNVEDPDDPYARLELAIRRGEDILISGGTGTGKTTFLNAMIKLLDNQERIVTLEDVQELEVPQPNHVHLLMSRVSHSSEGVFSYKDVFNLITRFTPDVIIGGEVSKYNANAFFELSQTGHKNFFATIHAGNPEEAYRAFAGRILEAAPKLDYEQTLTSLRNSFRVVQINRSGNLRSVTAIT
ncbi:MAG: Flp pilus assembly complex ATPase component TadA [Alphaproteobacteria bacterium]|nr:Flp pilus assembly complex ATPase component TadA [Alphaproteobacteria bacterium]